MYMDYSPINCTECKKPAVPIIYGFPTPEMVEAAVQEMIALGGTTNEKVATHYCYDCDLLIKCC